MEPEAVEIKLEKIMLKLFPKAEITISEQTTAGEVEGWNSLSHVKFLIAVEEEFGIQINLQDISSLKNIGDLRKYILKKKSL